MGLTSVQRPKNDADRSYSVCLCVRRDAMGHMKEGEEDKTKSYTALIWTQKAIDKDDITFLEETKVSVKCYF